MNRRGWIGVDLDGTLARYDGWRGPDHIGQPVPEMLDRVRVLLSEGWEVRIFTARASRPEEIHHVEEWLKSHGLGMLKVTNVKDFAMVTLYDDRCVQIAPNRGISIVDELSAKVLELQNEIDRLKRESRG